MFRPMRRFKQALSAEECLEVLKEEKRGTLALAGDEGYPYALPINYFTRRLPAGSISTEPGRVTRSMPSGAVTRYPSMSTMPG